MNDQTSNSRVHTIRLHGPWQVVTSQADANELPAKVKLPEGWREFSELVGAEPIQLVRRFGYPTGLSSEQTVWLDIQAEFLDGRVFLNDELIGELESGCLRVEVNRLLKPRNGLRFEFKQTNREPSSVKHIQLEIEE